MVRITVDEKLKQQLLASNEVVELVDESGQRFARVFPEPPADIDADALFPELTPEEIDRRCKEPGRRYTTEEVKQHLLDRNGET